MNWSFFDAFGVRNFGSAIKLNKFNFAAFALYAFARARASPVLVVQILARAVVSVSDKALGC